MNTPPPTPPEPASSREADLARLQAWQELHRQMMELHAQLEYANLLLRLGLRA